MMNKLTKSLINWLKTAVFSMVLVTLMLNFGLLTAQKAQASGFILAEYLDAGKITNAWSNKAGALINAQTGGPDPTDVQISSKDSIISPTKPEVFYRIIKVKVTGYSSTPDQTKAYDPFTMASGRIVYDGAVAANFLGLGTRIKIPGVFGDKVFTVEDRMNKRFSDRVDIWFPNRASAKKFGIQELEIVVF